MGELELPGVRLTRKLERPKIVAYDVDPPGLKDLGRRKLDGYACNENVGKQAIKEGIPIRALDERPSRSTRPVSRRPVGAGETSADLRMRPSAVAAQRARCRAADTTTPSTRRCRARSKPRLGVEHLTHSTWTPETALSPLLYPKLDRGRQCQASAGAGAESAPRRCGS
jgi:hypothetical protein